jgi:oligopeptide/dipeptide ABC transporter ATP-binding protein
MTAVDAPTTTALVAAEGLVKHFPIGTRRGFGGQSGKVVHAVEDVNLEIFPGEVVGLIGESGSGKSTFGRALLRLHDVTAGRVLFDGQDITWLKGEPLRRLRSRMSLVFQNPYGAVNRRRHVRDIVAQPLVAQGVSSADRALRVAELLKAVGVPALGERYPHELSGGELQRVVVARALSTEPDFIVADEPTASLDVSVRAQIVNLIADLRAERSIALLFISHDLRTVAHIADRVAVMYLGQLVEVGQARDVTLSPRHPYTNGLIASLPELHPQPDSRRKPAGGEIPNPASPPTGCRYHPRCPLAVDRCRLEAPSLEQKSDGRWVACHMVPQ